MNNGDKQDIKHELRPGVSPSPAPMPESSSEPTKETLRRGFAAMEPRRQRQIASKGGKAAHESGRAHEFTPEEARSAGRKGGERVSTDRAHMAAIGRKGGARVSTDRAHMAVIGRTGGRRVSTDRAHMAAIGRTGGKSRTKRSDGSGGPAVTGSA